MTPLGPAYAAAIGPRRLDYRPPAPGDDDCAECANERRLFCHDTLTAVPCRCATNHDLATLQAALSVHSNMDDRHGITFRSLSPDGPDDTDQASYRNAYQAAVQYAADPAGTFTIAGQPMTGKTALATAIANHTLNNGHPTLWTRAGDLIRALRRESYSGADEAAGQYRTHSFLLIDDIPPVPASGWEKELILLLVSERTDAQRPTVYVLRGTPEQADPDIAAKICRQHSGHSTCTLNRAEAGTVPTRRLPPVAMSSLMTFDTFHTEHSPDRLAIAKETVRMWAEQPTGWLCLTGTTGTGKTHLALAAMDVIANRTQAIYYAHTADLIAELRTTVNTPHDPLQPAMSAALLVLDDYGAERNTAFADEQLTRLLGHRYDRRLPTIITTNLTPDELKANRPRIASRLLDPTVTTLIPMNGLDYRAAS